MTNYYKIIDLDKFLFEIQELEPLCSAKALQALQHSFVGVYLKK